MALHSFPRGPVLRRVAQLATFTVRDSQLLPVPTDGHTLIDTVCGP